MPEAILPLNSNLTFLYVPFQKQSSANNNTNCSYRHALGIQVASYTRALLEKVQLRLAPGYGTILNMSPVTYVHHVIVRLCQLAGDGLLTSLPN